LVARRETLGSLAFLASAQNLKGFGLGAPGIFAGGCSQHNNAAFECGFSKY
jgi:hypothetical protein